ncbi:hypothetical protein VTK73DRAFT_9506 [Phialemonium thermophilum]|uniref:Uncharacterized protein n=1 Tax=Phialemonium thermophilum TaxID=223376 RepID=A0ABR3Y549_9PEZI
MDSVSLYSFSSFGWLTLQSIPLAAWPTFVISLLTPDFRHADVVQQHLARSLGFSQLAIGLLLVILTGSLPLTSMVESPSGSISPFTNAAVLITMLYHGAYALNTWVQYNYTRQAGYLLGAIGYGFFAAFGLWCLLFGSDKGHISKRTGADKRTSGFPFKNAEADKRRGKEL